jgi:tRNA(adenine34) deaminase
MPLDTVDEQFMRLALVEAERALAEGQLPVGAVIVHQGQVIASGRNQIDIRGSDLAHAEMEAIMSAQTFLSGNAKACAIYSPLEPCMMCFGTIVSFHFGRLIIGAPDRLVGARALIPGSPYYSRRAPSITADVLPDESRTLVAQYVAQTGFCRHLLTSMW